MDWHPFIVHFPIVLIIAGVILDAAAWLFRRTELHTAGLILFLAGAVTAVPAALTGESASETAGLIDGIAHDLTRHEDAATLTAWLVAGLALARIHLTVKKRFLSRIGRVWLLAAVLSALLAGWSGYTGGVLVYRYGAGTQPIASPEAE